MERRRSGRGGWGRDLGISPLNGPKLGQKTGKNHRILWDLQGYFPASPWARRGCDDVEACGTYRDTLLEVFSASRDTCGSELVGLTGACLSFWRHLRTKAALRRT